MATQRTGDVGSIERVRHAVSAAGLGLIVLSLIVGLVLSLAGQAALSMQAFALAVSVLVLMPTVGVAAVLAEEVARRDWAFAGIALGVLLLILYIVYDLTR